MIGSGVTIDGPPYNLRWEKGASYGCRQAAFDAELCRRGLRQIRVTVHLGGLSRSEC